MGLQRKHLGEVRIMAKKLMNTFVQEWGDHLEVWCSWPTVLDIVRLGGVRSVVSAPGFDDKYWVFTDPRYDFKGLVKEIKALA